MRRPGYLLVALLLLGGCAGSGTPAASAPTTTAASTPAASVPASTVPTTTTAAPTTTEAPLIPVVIDPGHNGGNAAAPDVIGALVPDGNGGTKPCNTTGTSTDAGYPEHAFTLDVANRVADLLLQRDVESYFTRTDDTGVGPCVDQRAAVSAQVGAAAFIGIHGDGAAAGSRGFHVITSSLAPAGPAVAEASSALAADVRDALTSVLPVSDYLGTAGLDARDDLAGLNLNAAPAIYVECGNMRNPTDAALMSSESGRQAIAEQIAAGVLTFLGR